jgi:hypothetical protein
LRKSVEKRLADNIIVTGFCWLWTGCLNERGYGDFRLVDRMERAHRAVYRYLMDTNPPEELVANHLCKVRNCVNPDHIEFVTQRENVLYSYSPAGINARKTHCKRGHELAGDNLYIKPTGSRICKTCKNEEQNKARREGRRAYSPNPNRKRAA